MGKRLNELRYGKNKICLFGLEVIKRLYIMGRNQSWLAEQCGVSKQYISQIIYGKSKPSEKIIKQIAKVFKMDIQELRKLALKVT